MKLKFLESLMDIKPDLEPIYKAGFKPIKINGKISEEKAKSYLALDSYVAIYDDGKLVDIYFVNIINNNRSFPMVSLQSYKSQFDNIWLPLEGTAHSINDGTIIPVIKKDDYARDYEGDDTEIDE